MNRVYKLLFGIEHFLYLFVLFCFVLLVLILFLIFLFARVIFFANFPFILFSSLFFYIRHIPYPSTAGSARNNAKKRDEKERMKKKQVGQRAKPYTPSQAIDARMGEEEKKRTKERNRERVPNPAIWTIWPPLTTRMDHMVSPF